MLSNGADYFFKYILKNPLICQASFHRGLMLSVGYTPHPIPLNRWTRKFLSHDKTFTDNLKTNHIWKWNAARNLYDLWRTSAFTRSSLARRGTWPCVAILTSLVLEWIGSRSLIFNALNPGTLAMLLLSSWSIKDTNWRFYREFIFEYGNLIEFYWYMNFNGCRL